MGQYKVPQDVEAEDKILGPLTFKEFIYALIGFGWAVVIFGLFRTIPVLMIILGLPPTFLFLMLAFFKRDGQSFEHLLIAMVEYFASPHRRIWEKNDPIESFHINPTAHAAEATQRNPVEVRSELEKLANLIDSRGWNHPPEAEPNPSLPTTAHEDRIVPPPAPRAPDEVPEDILDLQQSPLAQNLAELLRAAAEDVREEAMQQMTGKTVRPSANQPAPISTSGVTAPSAPAILQLATQSDELTVSQLAAQATRRVQLPNGETVEVPVSGS